MLWEPCLYPFLVLHPPLHPVLALFLLASPHCAHHKPHPGQDREMRQARGLGWFPGGTGSSSGLPAKGVTGVHAAETKKSVTDRLGSGHTHVKLRVMGNVGMSSGGRCVFIPAGHTAHQGSLIHRIYKAHMHAHVHAHTQCTQSGRGFQVPPGCSPTLLI